MSRWFRFYDDAINDPKILKLSDGLHRIWVGILCIASKNDGALPPIDDIALMIRMKPAKAKEAIEKLIECGLIDEIDGDSHAAIMPHNWDARQFKSDVSTPRVKRFRNNKRNVSETPPETEQIQTTEADSSSLRSESAESDWPKDHFAQFWALYPRKVGKKAAARRLDSVRRAGEIGWAALLAAIARIDRKDPQFIPHPSTWLHEGRYLDGIATGPPPTAEPVWMKPPPGAVSYLDKMRTNGNGATLGTEIRNDAGLGKSGPDHPAELPLPGGSSLRRA